jgi:predicted peptidase
VVKAPLQGEVQKGTWRSGDINGQHYSFLLPQGYDPSLKYPVIMFLHYNGQAWAWYVNGQDEVTPAVDPYFNTVEFRRNYPAIVIVPFCNQKGDNGSNINFGGVTPGVQESERNNLNLLNQFKSQYSVANERVYLVGTSMGAIAAWSYMIKYNSQTGTDAKVFRAGMMFDGNPYAFGNPSQDLVNAMRNVPLFSIHGSNDQQVPVRWDEAIYSAMGGSVPGNGGKAPNGAMRFLEPGIGHGSWNQYLPLQNGNKDKWDWIYNQ